MMRLPLFPLNTVLFPGMPISLHIFEERYKLMISRCIKDQQPFGVVLIESGAEVEGAGPDAKPHAVGCSALITRVQPVGFGRMNIVALGQERFIIHTLHNDEAYITADVELHPLPVTNADALATAIDYLRPWLERYLHILQDADDVEFDLDQLPQDETALAYLAASLLKTSMTDKQALLESVNAERLTLALHTVYRKEVTLLRALLRQPAVNVELPFSLN